MAEYMLVPHSRLLLPRANFRHVEHFLLALSSVFVAYVVSGVLAHPDWVPPPRAS